MNEDVNQRVGAVCGDAVDGLLVDDPIRLRFTPFRRYHRCLLRRNVEDEEHHAHIREDVLALCCECFV